MKTIPEKPGNIVVAIKEEFDDISYALDERRKRLWCAARAKAYNRKYGRGGVMVVHKATKRVSTHNLSGIKRSGK